MWSVMKTTSVGDNELDLELQATHSFILNCGSDHLSEWETHIFTTGFTFTWLKT